MKRGEDVLKNHMKVLNYLKEHYPIFHKSNVFMRDVQYGLQSLLKDEGMIVSYGTAENLAWKFVRQMVSLGIFVPIDQQSWTMNFPDFRTRTRKTPPTAKSAVSQGTQPASDVPAQQQSTK